MEGAFGRGGKAPGGCDREEKRRDVKRHVKATKIEMGVQN